MSNVYLARVQLFLTVAIFMSSPLWPMEGNNDVNIEIKRQEPQQNCSNNFTHNLARRGITLGDLEEEWEKTYWEKVDMRPSIDGCLKCFYITFLPAFLPAGILVSPFCNGYFSSDPPLNMTNPEPYQPINNATAFFSDPSRVCPVSVGTLCLPVVIAGIAGAQYVYQKVQHYFADKLNAPKQQWLDDLVDHRTMDMELTEENMRVAADYLFTSPSLLKKLNVKQAMILSEVNFERFKDAVNSVTSNVPEDADKIVFADDVQVYAQELLKLHRSATEGLLEQEPMYALVKAEPSLLQALICTLSEESMSDAHVMSVLKTSLRKLFEERQQSHAIDIAFQKIREKRVFLANLLR